MRSKVITLAGAVVVCILACEVIVFFAKEPEPRMSTEDFEEIGYGAYDDYTAVVTVLMKAKQEVLDITLEAGSSSLKQAFGLNMLDGLGSMVSEKYEPKGFLSDYCEGRGYTLQDYIEKQEQLKRKGHRFYRPYFHIDPESAVY